MSETRDFESLRPADQAIVRSLRILLEREGAAEQYWQEMNFGARVRYVVGDRDPDLVRLDRAAEQARGTLRERIDDRLREMPSDQLAKLNIAADRFADNRARGIDRTAREMSPSYAQAADREGSLKRHLLNADIGLAHMEHDANKTAADMHDRRKQMNVLQSRCPFPRSECGRHPFERTA